MIRSIVTFFFIIISCGCSDEYAAENYSAGPNGEPPKALTLVYSKQFVAEEKNYVKAMGEIHTFLIENDFYPIYRPCFSDVLNMRVIANRVKYKKVFPCIVIQAEKGAPTKIYLRVLIDEIKFNQLDYNDRFMYTVGMYGRKDLVGTFVSKVEPRLTKPLSAMSIREQM